MVLTHGAHIECSHRVLTHRKVTNVWWCDVVRMPSGPRTRPKNFFFVFSSLGLWCVMVSRMPSGPRTRPKNFFFVFSSFGLRCVMVRCGRWAIRPKNSAQELLLCVLLCVMVRCGVVSHLAQELGPRTSSLCSLLSACDVWYGESAHTHRVLTHSAHT